MTMGHNSHFSNIGINMVFVDVFKNIQMVKVMAKTKLSQKYSPFLLYFRLCWDLDAFLESQTLNTYLCLSACPPVRLPVCLPVRLPVCSS
jgi:hypothetical protein